MSDQYGWGGTPYPPPPASPLGQPPVQQPPPVRRAIRPRVWILALVGALVLAAVVVVIALVRSNATVDDAPGTAGRRLVSPASVAGFAPVTDVNFDDLKATFGEDIADKGDDPKRAVAHAVVTGFEKQPSGPRAVIVAIAIDDVPSIRAQTRSDGADATLRFFMAGAGKGLGAGLRSTGFPAGSLGGFLRCSAGTVDGDAVTACGWSDESALALVIFYRDLPLATAASDTRTLRAAVEKP